MTPLYDYVPEPRPVSSDFTVAAHYYPGWKRGGADVHNGFEDLKPFPERTPLLGYYDEADPTAADWEIKWAVEHGVNCFIYCWYRYRDNMGKPVTRESLRFGHAIHDALFHARYRDYMKFAIMWECSNERWGTALNVGDALDNLLPFWVENYFRKSNYLTFEGKPVLYIYNVRCLIEDLGSEDALAELIAGCDERIRDYGFPGLHFSAMDNGWSKEGIASFFSTGRWLCDKVPYWKKLGFSSAFQYNWHFHRHGLTDEQFETYKTTLKVPDEVIVKHECDMIKLFASTAPDFYMLTASVMWDRSPWAKIFNIDPLGALPHWQLSPDSFKRVLEVLRDAVTAFPENAIGRKIVVMDNWNEWSEGHYLSPNAGYGFAHLEAIRSVFTRCDNLPDYRLPETIGLPLK